MTRIPLDNVVYDGSIYPRQKPSTSTISQYVDALAGGAKFPPIILEKGTNRLLDGYHRWKAHLKYRDEGYQVGFDATESRDDLSQAPTEIEIEYHEVPDGITAKLYALSLSARHGLRPTPADRKQAAREQYELMPGTSSRIIAEYLGQARRTVDNYIKDLKAQYEETRNATIIRLNWLGWTQQEIADKLSALFPDGQGTSQPLINKKLSDLAELPILIMEELDKGHSISTVAQRFGLPLLFIWRIWLERQDDLTRMNQLDIKVQPYDVWNFHSCHKLLGDSHPGRIPGELVAHVLFYYTKEGDVVLDPMAGSGTTPDTCLVMHRKCYAYDIDMRHERPDILEHDILQGGWPSRIKDADLIFWDPPYYKKMDSQTIGDEGYITDSISKLDKQDYLDFFGHALKEAFEQTKSGARLAFLMSDWDEQGDGIFIWDYIDLIRGAGWHLIKHIQAPLSTQQVHPDIVNKFRTSRRMARLERYLLICEKA